MANVPLNENMYTRVVCYVRGFAVTTETKKDMDSLIEICLNDTKGRFGIVSMAFYGPSGQLVFFAAKGSTEGIDALVDVRFATG